MIVHLIDRAATYVITRARARMQARRKVVGQ